MKLVANNVHIQVNGPGQGQTIPGVKTFIQTFL